MMSHPTPSCTLLYQSEDDQHFISVLCFSYLLCRTRDHKSYLYWLRNDCQWQNRPCIYRHWLLFHGRSSLRSQPKIYFHWTIDSEFVALSWDFLRSLRDLWFSIKIKLSDIYSMRKRCGPVVYLADAGIKLLWVLKLLLKSCLARKKSVVIKH